MICGKNLLFYEATDYILKIDPLKNAIQEQFLELSYSTAASSFFYLIMLIIAWGHKYLRWWGHKYLRWHKCQFSSDRCGFHSYHKSMTQAVFIVMLTADDLIMSATAYDKL